MRNMSDELWVQGLPMIAVSENACAKCNHTILNGMACAQRCCVDGGQGCMPLRRDNVHIPKGFH